MSIEPIQTPAPAKRGLSRDAQRRLQRVAWHLVGLFPLAWLVFDFWFGLLGPEPIRAIILRTGKSAIILLVASLAITPLSAVTGWKSLVNWRRPLGLYGFLYVCLHLLTFVWLDYGFMWGLIVEEIIQRRYALVGFAAFLLLIPLAVTSTRGWQKRLGKKWTTLHRLVYVIAILAVVHYIWLVKNAYAQPLLFAALVALLLFMRLPAVRKGIIRLRRSLAR